MIYPYWIPLKSIWTKEIKRFTRIWIQTLMPPVITMTLYFYIFGNLIGSQIKKIQGFNYIEFIVPGLIMMAVIYNSYTNVASSFFNAKLQRSIEELLIAPIPTHIIIIGYVGGGVARGICVGFLLTLISMLFVHFHVYSWLITISIVLLTVTVFSLAGLLNALFAKNFDDISLIPTLIITPLSYLGGVFYSINLLPRLWQNLSKFNPIMYMISGFRLGILGIQDVSLSITVVILITLIIIFYLLIWKLIQQGYGLKN
ncbi:MAG: ABC transporter permease [Candidatus Dasytiphilus stammeri]